MYATNIVEQLQLKALVETRIKPEPSTEKILELSIDVVDVAESLHTIHQLFWELLEDPQLFNGEFQTVTVVRSLGVTENPTQPMRVATLPKEESTINILLVVARDTSQDAALYNDISPFLTTNILLDIKRNLEKNHRTVHMNIEIVRPGTFKAFEDHLEASKRRHGPGYFHIVHFDLHGKIGARSGALEKKKVAFLYFAHPREERTKPERVQKIAAVLQRYQVPFVVLNACESARAGLGDDANIAKVFCRSGIRNVVAMSFKISSSAASIFLREFYASLLVTGSSFPASAFTARALLRCSPKRSARYGLTRSLMDWFVPVVYVPVVDGSAEVSAPKTESSVESLSKPPLAGRDFDVLGFERLLIQQRSIYLYGPRGSGKSSFVQYISSLWQKTSRVEAVLYLDMAKARVENLTDLVRILIGKLSENLVEIGSKLVVSPHILDVRASDKAGLVDLFLKMMRKIPTFIIFDNLFISHSRSLKGAMSKSARAIFNDFVKILLDFVSTDPHGQSTYVVLVGFQSFAWAQETLAYSSPNGVFELLGLQLADGIELLQETCPKDRTMNQHVITQDLDSLELIVKLFQGLPGALKLLASSSAPLNVLYDNLLSLPGRQGALDIHIGSHLQEISDLVDKTPGDYQRLMSLLGSFWHEGDCANILATLLPLFPQRNSRYVVPGDQGLSCNVKILESLQELGYLDQYNSTGGWDAHTSIHPMLSIYARLPHTCERERPASNATEHDQTDPLQTFHSSILGLDWEHIFLISVARSVRDRWNVPREPTRPSDHRYVLGVTNLPNILNCIDVCISKERPLPLVFWPLRFFEHLALVVPDVASVVEFRLFGHKFELLLAAFFDCLGSIEVPVAYQSFAATAHAFTMSAHALQGMGSPEGLKKLIDRGIEVFKATESRYGFPSNRAVLFETSSLYLLDARFNLFFGTPREARTSWQQAQKLMDHLTNDDSNTAGGSEINIFAADGESLFQFISDAMGMGRQSCTDEPSALDVERRVVDILSANGAFMDKEISHMEQVSESEHAGDFRMNMAEEFIRGAMQLHTETSAGLDKCYELQGLERQIPNLLQSFLATRAEDNSEGRFGEANVRSHLEGMEKSTDTGDWNDVARHHEFFAEAARHNLDFKQMAAHVHALHGIYSHSPTTFPRKLEEIQTYKCFLDPLLLDDHTDPPMHRHHTVVRMRAKTAFDSVLETFDATKNRSNDGAKLHELALQVAEGISPQALNESIHVALPQYRKPEGSTKRLIEFMELHLQIKSTAKSRDWEKLLPLLDGMFKQHIADYFGGESNSAVWQEIQNVRTWLQESLPLLNQFDQAIEESNLALAGSIFASLKQTEYPGFGVWNDIMKDTSERIQALKLEKSMLKLDEPRNSSVVEASEPSTDEPSRFQMIL
ncbi:hypothetical protein N7488_000316 [Penicillium malachiteum]|nr:hypothetical protein N7488_000316 [Penicillium malachiteum]